MDAEARARELVTRWMVDSDTGRLRNGPALEGRIAAALIEAHAAGAEPYAREALLVLSEAGIPTPERGYVADGGAGLMGGDLRRLWAAGRRAALEEARGAVEADAAEMERRAANTAGQGLDRQTACAATAARALREAAAAIAALKDQPHGR